MPKPIVDWLYAETVKALKSPYVVNRPQYLGLDAGGMTPEELTTKFGRDIPKLGKIVRDSGAKVDCTVYPPGGLVAAWLRLGVPI